MTRMNCNIWCLLVVLMWIFCISQGTTKYPFYSYSSEKLESCIQKSEASLIVSDSFYCAIVSHNLSNFRNSCILFLQKNPNANDSLDDWWPQLNENNSNVLYLTKRHVNQNMNMSVLSGRQCNETQFNITDFKVANHHATGWCNATFFNTGGLCKNIKYDQNKCSVDQRYVIDIVNNLCYNCDNPVKIPDQKIQMNVSVKVEEGGTIDPAVAVEIMSKMSDLASSINGSSAELNVGGGITGVIVANKNPVDISEVSFAYASPNTSINVVGSDGDLAVYSRSVTVPKEAFEKALKSNITVTFAALMRFTNFSMDDQNSTVLGNEVLAVEMGANIANLTTPINITFRNIKFIGTPSCHSWNGKGSKPNWTDEGCNTTQTESSIICQCSHLTFFAILMTTVNETISSSDLNNLTIITQVGCGLSMFFLSIILFMHFLIRKGKASKATRILIHLVVATFLLNFTFLINNYVAKMDNSVGCKIIAALMHYFMLTTFTWFAVHAFHICLQLYTGGKIVTRHYIIKVCVTTWVMPSIAGIVLLITEKYGKQVIHADNSADNVAMCWITDNNIHYFVNIAYYALVFLFTFTTFIIIICWLICLKRNQSQISKVSKNGKSIITILGLCCMLGIGWGFAFFAYGALKIPAFYIFTILNSLQGFFLFIYYYNISSHTTASSIDVNVNLTGSSTSTLKSSLDMLENPYSNLPHKS